MRTMLFLASLAVFTALPAFAQLGPAGVPGAPGLAPEPAPEPAPAPAKPAAPQKQEKKTGTPAKVPAACAKAKNVKQCVARQELRRKARAACKGKASEAYKQCVSDYLNRRKK